MVLGDGMGDAGSGFLVNLFWFVSRLGEQTVSTPWVCVFLLGFLPNGHHRLPFSSLVREEDSVRLCGLRVAGDRYCCVCACMHAVWGWQQSLPAAVAGTHKAQASEWKDDRAFTGLSQHSRHKPHAR
ncbi:hypothetical protein Tc00.1047053511771.171 [Trypanosoma cruzi]|uniref:Uncharacterized protein n=1 Tax=Trypanosoma cruzi (strain CL Brener) TaxID=353153 RepID=Q4DUJ2_TRYCC|nr:hypothetical protein Tc00.1047053511771.171 [Trypanosoma cruzi]EAN96196.1 hypothetical protein Tc00.1047053511771.171 [Trypanosoma cruzi]|eukprot:XP_818047.1 hypothetical protein [Trypanosoma cruzi strain CL Brener]